MTDIYPPQRLITTERIRFNCDSHALEGRLAYRDEGHPAFSTLIAGPHPLLGGDIENNVVRALAAGVAMGGGLAMTFNYGGVGDSEGGPQDWPMATSLYWNDGRIDEEHQWAHNTETAASTLHELTSVTLTGIGYSFGCWALAKSLENRPLQALVLISPNPTKHSFASLRGINIPTLVIHSENDFACNTAIVRRWCSSLHPGVEFRLMPSAEHFFRGQERSVVNTVLDYFRQHLPCKVGQP